MMFLKWGQSDQSGPIIFFYKGPYLSDLYYNLLQLKNAFSKYFNIFDSLKTFFIIGYTT